MGVWFIFRYNSKTYKATDSRIVEEQSCTSEYIGDLFDLETDFLKRKKVYACFVQEFQTGSSPDAWKQYIPGLVDMKTWRANMDFFIRKYIKNDPIAWKEKDWTGPSVPFDPEVLQKWAATWHHVIKVTPDDNLHAILDDITTVGNVLSDLEDLAKFAERAKNANQKVVLQVRY